MALQPLCRSLRSEGCPLSLLGQERYSAHRDSCHEPVGPRLVFNTDAVEKFNIAVDPSSRQLSLADQGDRQEILGDVLVRSGEHTRMSRGEKFVAGLAASVLVAGFAVGGSANPTYTSPQGSLPLTDVLSSSGTIDRPRTFFGIRLNGSKDVSDTMQIICRSADRVLCAAAERLLCAELFNCRSRKLVQFNRSHPGNHG
jgi:hypothetical protein